MSGPTGFNVINFPADVGGCGHYRIMFPSWALRTIRRDIRFVESFKLIVDPYFYKDFRAIQLQRQVNDVQCEFILKFLKPLSAGNGIWLYYSVDDVIDYEDIPPYNAARVAFDNKNFFNNVKNIIHASDFLIVTTDRLKQYYQQKYDFPAHKIIPIPNYLSRWWIGEAYNEARQENLFISNHKRPKIGLPLSSSHYDADGRNGYQDDLTHILNFIRSTTHKYEWCFIGNYPKPLEDLVREKKVTLYSGSDLLNYPRELHDKGLQCVVAPLRDNIFNVCKSNIKLIEMWALGIPVISQNLACYDKYTNMLFKDENDLQDQLDIVFKHKHKYMNIVRENRHVVDYGDSNSPNGWWLEKNLGTWMNMFTMPQKGLKFDLTVPRQNQAFQNKDMITLDLSN